MKAKKLNYRFHNPNSPEKTAEYLLKVLLQSNKEKVENAINNAKERMYNDSR